MSSTNYHFYCEPQPKGEFKEVIKALTRVSQVFQDHHEQLEAEWGPAQFWRIAIKNHKANPPPGAHPWPHYELYAFKNFDGQSSWAVKLYEDDRLGHSILYTPKINYQICWSETMKVLRKVEELQQSDPVDFLLTTPRSYNVGKSTTFSWNR
ncbi:hypothetical protein BDN72DRAFT_882635, partial [Pluteus cervinus]